MYEKFLKIDGSHPWRDVSPEGYIDYPVRYRPNGKVLFFNFVLAKELGLIPSNHPRQISKILEDSILKTFSLQILNEYDWENRRSFPRDGLEDRLYMATRYLQTQHESRTGETSGDGRSIWNGSIRNGRRTYDISSCGTGNTILSPGAQESKDPIQTGSHKYGYASGLAEIDELLGGAVMSEIFYREGYPTERCLAVIEYPDKTGIGVRVAPNLIRPAHLFRYVKSNQYDELKDSFDYFISRQEKNGELVVPQSGKTRYTKTLEYLAAVYAKLAAVMEEEYIFNWLAWDGDNILASGAILDYGSIRQFNAKHSKYRYEDVDRYSTTLTEQKYWARKITQTFIQVVDYICTKEKKNLDTFEEHPIMDLFDQRFELERHARMLWRMGFTPKQIEKLKTKHRLLVDDFRKVLNYFEDIKTRKGEEKVPDGINHPPVFLVRNILRSLPVFCLNHYKKERWPIMEEEHFCKMMAAAYVDQDDVRLNSYRTQKAIDFQKLYCQLIRAAGRDAKKTLRMVARRSGVINYEFRKTGDGITWIVHEALKARNRMRRKELQTCIERFIQSQVLIPGKWKPIREQELKGKTLKSHLLQKMQENLEIYCQTI